MDDTEQRPTQPPSRPAWMLTGPETLTELDQLHQTLTHLAARRLELLAHLDQLGHARTLGARDTTELLSLRHRLDPQTIHRDLRTATTLTTCPTVATQLPGYPTPTPTTTNPTTGDPTTVDLASGDAASGEAAAAETGSGQAGAAEVAGADGGEDPVAVLVDRRRAAQASKVTLNPAQAAAITEALAKVPTHVPTSDLAVAEAELVIAARTLLPKELRRLGRAMLDRLDTDGPPPPELSREPATDEGTDHDPNAPGATALAALAASDEASEAARLAETLWWTPGSVPDPTGRSGVSGRVRGLRFGGFVTGENAELFQTLIDAAAKLRKTPQGELDPRTIGQRRADALAIVLRAAAATGSQIPAHGGIKPHLSVTIPYTTLTTHPNFTTLRSLTTTSSTSTTPTPDTTARSLTNLAPDTLAGPLTNPAPGNIASSLTNPAPDASAAGLLADLASGSVAGPVVGLGSDSIIGRAAGMGSDLVAGPLVSLGSSAGTGLLVFGDPLPVGEVRRIACDAGVIPIVLGARGEPLDVGREQRLVTPAIRRALIARDGGCVIPGCGAPPGHCDAHHLMHWADGGITAVTNLALVCPTHHRAIHRGVWIVTIVDSQVRITRPAWTEPGPSG